jgi:large subunit ribosomal protein L24
MGLSVKKDDQVMVIAGKDRGHIGRVVRVLPGEGRVMVDGAARAKKATRPSQRVQQGGIIDTELFIDISNVMVVCKACDRPTRIGNRLVGDTKIRYCKKCDAEI